MDSFCDNLLLAIFQFVHSDDRFRFIMLGKKYHNVVSEYIASPEWVCDQINQIIKDNTVNCGIRADCLNLSCASLGCQNVMAHNTNDHFAELMLHRLNINVFRLPYNVYWAVCSGEPIAGCEYGCTRDHPHECTEECACSLETLITGGEKLDIMIGVPPDTPVCFADCSKLFKFPSPPGNKYFTKWIDDDSYIRDVVMCNETGTLETRDFYTRPCIDDIIPIKSIYEFIGIVVHNMTGIKQICEDLNEYDIQHLRLFRIVHFIKCREVIAAAKCVQKNLLSYGIFAERILQKSVRMDVKSLVESFCDRRLQYTFMIHPEIEFKSADVATHIMLFGTQ